MFKNSLGVAGVLLVAAGIIFSSPSGSDNAHAFGVGGYLTYGSGNVDFEERYDPEDLWASLDNKGDQSHFGIGFVFDTAVAKNKLFNYRLQIGYEAVEYDIHTVFNKDTGVDLSGFVTDFTVDVDMIVFDNSFGFGIVRKENFRLWIGPQLRVGYLSGHGKLTDVVGTVFDLDFDGVVYGFAPVVGANFHFENNLTFGLDLGYRWSGFAGALQKAGMGVSTGDDIIGNADGFFVNFSIIYRFDDNYY